MSNFECNIEDLIESDKNKEDNQINLENIKQETTVKLDNQRPQRQNNNMPIPKKKNPNDIKTPEKENVKDTMMQVILNDMKDKKNHKIFMVIIFMYLLLNSQPIYKLIYDMFPYLMESVTKINIKGQIVIAIIISIGVIISNSSLFQ
jgi:bifunctional DNA-binding transcriptional regulator/antitoxin component of YhaV-PrlF toxin-antitoxin module|tara:strand:- start:472 stop:912 length:441 start_codon:yes stop_codon:yes gene_type:complete